MCTISRIARIVNGECFIGMRSISMIPLIAFDAVVNVYLTIIFLIPLKSKSLREDERKFSILTSIIDLYSFRNLPKTNANSRLRNVAFRTFVGACCTLTSSIVYVPLKSTPLANELLTWNSSNLTVLMVLDGEPGWVCLMCCNSDGTFQPISRRNVS